MSPTPDSTLADPQQIIADLKRQLAESNAERDHLRSERDEALEQQTATTEVLQVINSSPGDLAPVFDAILEKALRLCSAAHGSLFTLVDDTLHQVASVDATPQLVALRQQQGPNRIEPGTAFYPLLEGQGIVHLADVRESAAYRDFPAIRERLDAANARSMLAVALRKDEALLGVLDVYRQEVQPFSDKQIALLENFAAQAVIAMENARLISETREALEQQTATAEVLGVINSSPGDLGPVFDAMLEKATRLCDAAFGQLYTYEGETFAPAAVQGEAQFIEWLRQRGPWKPLADGHSPMARVVRGEHIVHIANVLNDESYHEADSSFPQHVDSGGIRSLLTVALRKDDALLGAMTVYRQEIRPFNDKQIALLQNFAAQAVIAIENARLITETREALEQQTATAEVLQVINSSPGDLVPVFDAILEKAHSLCGAATGSLRIIDGDMIRAVAFRGQSGEFADQLQQGYPFANAPLLASLRDGAPFVHISDVAERDDPISRLSTASGNRTMLAVPLRKDDALLGMIVAGRQEVRPFTDKQIALLQNFAAQAVIAIDNARLITETREALEQQTATSEVLGVINSSPGDLAPVFDAILEKATSLCDAPCAIFWAGGGERFRATAVYGVSDAFAEFLHRNQGAWPSRSLDAIRRGKAFVHNLDLAETRADSTNPLSRAVRDLGHARTALLVPLVKDGALLGAIRIFRKEVRPFTDKQITLLQNFAAQAVIAMENARLLSELRQRTEEVAELNRGLEVRVAEQVDELGRVGRLKRFLAPQLAELIVSHGDEKILESHRREIVVVFCDLRGYTAFTETAEPEEVLDFLRQYHGAFGPLVSQFEGTLDQFSGDGIMVFFNDPVPIPDPAERAVKMAIAMRSAANTLIADWRERGRDLGFGAGIAQGYATLGQIGFSERSGYTAIGTVCNVAARLPRPRMAKFCSVNSSTSH